MPGLSVATTEKLLTILRLFHFQLSDAKKGSPWNAYAELLCDESQSPLAFQTQTLTALELAFRQTNSGSTNLAK
jgi:hypothetical protein